MSFVPFSYCLDAAGNLLKLVEGKAAASLIKNAVELVTPAQELKHPYPWTKTVAGALDEVRFLPESLVAGTLTDSLYRTGEILVSPFIYVEPTTDFAGLEHILEVIHFLDQLAEGTEEAEQLVSALASVGVKPIPILPSAGAEIVTGKPTEPARYKVQGWISNTDVIRKAVWA